MKKKQVFQISGKLRRVCHKHWLRVPIDHRHAEWWEFNIYIESPTSFVTMRPLNFDDSLRITFKTFTILHVA